MKINGISQNNSQQKQNVRFGIFTVDLSNKEAGAIFKKLLIEDIAAMGSSGELFPKGKYQCVLDEDGVLFGLVKTQPGSKEEADEIDKFFDVIKSAPTIIRRIKECETFEILAKTKERAALYKEKFLQFLGLI